MMASPFTVGSKWLITRAGAADQHIQVKNATATNFTAVYIGIDNPSVFNGEVEERETQAISLRQFGANTAYFAYHIGLVQKTAPGQPQEYQGQWCDVAGDQGAFQLIQVS
jgi:hypothetical protein